MTSSTRPSWQTAMEKANERRNRQAALLDPVRNRPAPESLYHLAHLIGRDCSWLPAKAEWIVYQATGIGPARAKAIVRGAGVPPNRRIRDMTHQQVTRLVAWILQAAADWGREGQCKGSCGKRTSALCGTCRACRDVYDTKLARNLRADGMSDDEIMATLEFGERRLRSLIGINPSRLRRPVTEEEVTTMRQLRSEGLTYAEIGARFGRHSRTAWKIVNHGKAS